MRVRRITRGPWAGSIAMRMTRADRRAEGIARPSPHALALARHRAPVDVTTCGPFRGSRYIREAIAKGFVAWYAGRPKIPFTDEKLDAVRRVAQHRRHARARLERRRACRRS